MRSPPTCRNSIETRRGDFVVAGRTDPRLICSRGSDRSFPAGTRCIRHARAGSLQRWGPRAMPNTFTWINTSDGTTDDWSDASAWQINSITPAAPPGHGDIALINQYHGHLGDPYTVQINYGEFEAAAALTLDYAGAFPGRGNPRPRERHASGHVDAAKRRIPASGRHARQCHGLRGRRRFLTSVPGEYTPANYGTLNNVTVVGGLDLTVYGITIENGLTVLPAGGSGIGAITIGAAPFDTGQSGLDFVGTQTLDNVTVTLGIPIPPTRATSTPISLRSGRTPPSTWLARRSCAARSPMTARRIRRRAEPRQRHVLRHRNDRFHRQPGDT